MHHRLLLLLGLITAITLGTSACDGAADDDDDSTADDDDDDSYEEGCILVNGAEPGYASLADAVYVAGDGDFITLCAGTFVGSVVIDKSLTITGEGVDETIVTGDAVETTLSIEAPDVSLAQMTVRSSRNAIDVANVTGTVLTDLILDESGQYALSVNGGQVALSDVRISGFAFAGIVAQHATLDAANLAISAGEGYGMRLVDSAASVTGGSIADIAVPADTDDSDGTCVYIEDAPVAASFDGVSFSGCTRVALWANGSDVQVVDGAFSASNYGVLVFTGGAEGSIVADTTFDEIPYYGIFVLDGDLEATGNQIVATAAVADQSIGIYAGHDDDDARFVIEGNTVQGYLLYGINIQPQDDLFGIDWVPAGGTATVADNQVLDGALFGYWISALDQLTFTGNTVDGIQWSEELSATGQYYIEGGVYLNDIDDVTMADNVVTNVDTLGMTLYGVSFTSTGLDVSETHLVGVYLQDSSGTLTDCTIHDLDIYGIQSFTASLDVDGCTFTGVRDAVPPDQWSLPEDEQYSYSGPAVYYYEAQGRVSNSAFTANDYQGVDVYDSNVTVELNTFDDNYTGVFFSGDVASGYPITVQDNTFGDHDWCALYAYDTDATVQRNAIAGEMSTGFYASSYYGVFDSNTVEVPYTAIQVYAYDAATMLGPGTYSNNTFTGGSTGVTCYYYADELILDGNVFDGVDQAIYVYDYSPGDEALTLVDNTFLASGGTPIRIEDFSAVTFAGTNVVDGNASGDAVTISDAGAVTIDGLQVVGAAANGLSATSQSFSMSGSTLSSAAASGIVLDGSQGTMTIDLVDNAAFSGNGGDGIDLAGNITGTITGNAIEANGAYGIGCSSLAVTLDLCINTMSGNVLGDFQETGGCALGCIAQ